MHFNFINFKRCNYENKTIFTRSSFCVAGATPRRRQPAWHVGVEKYREAGGEVEILNTYQFWVTSTREVIPEKGTRK